MNDTRPKIETAITLPYRPILLLMLTISAISLAGAGATIATAQPASAAIAAD